jgi:hypothetical protein
MAEQWQWIPREELAAVRRSFMAKFVNYDHFYNDQPPAIRTVGLERAKPDFYFLFPEQLYQRACSIDPSPEAFEKWLNWAGEDSDWKAGEQAAEAWRRARPHDSRPLLYLMEAAEQREALKKAIGYLEQAEKLDALNPEVRRARIRLLVMGAIRHLRQRKIHLAEKELQALETLPQAQEGDRPAFVAALRWTARISQADFESASREFNRSAEVLGSQIAAALACGSVGAACQLDQAELNRHLTSKGTARGSVAAAVARACALGDDMGIGFGIPADWAKEAFRELSAKDCPLDVRQLRIVAEAALRQEQQELAYAASSTGLVKGGTTEARFLLLRAQALPPWEDARRDDCIAAAAELARRNRDMDLVDEAVELGRGGDRHGMDFFDWLGVVDHQAFSMTNEKLNAVLKRERESRDFPCYKPPSWTNSFKDEPFFEDDEAEEEEWEKELDEFEPTPEDLAEFIRALARAAGKKAGRKKGRSPFPAPGGWS